MLVTSSQFFSDGAIFDLCPNARCLLPSQTPPDDMACMAMHYAGVA